MEEVTALRISGMCLAFAYLNKTKPPFFAWLILGIVSLLKTAIQVKFCAFFIMFMLYFDAGDQKMEALHTLVSSRIARFLGDTSYAVYLLHNLILLPVLYILLHQVWFLGFSPYKRLFIAFLCVGIPVYSFSYFLFKAIELPGIELGRKILFGLRMK